MLLNLQSKSAALEHLGALEPGTPVHDLQDAIVQFLSGDHEGCVGKMLVALERSPERAWNVIVREASFQLAHSIRVTNRTAEVAAFLDDLFADHSTMTTISIHDPVDNSDGLRLRERGIARNLPSAAIITLTKSGSVSVGAILASGFGLPTVTYSAITEAVIPSWSQDFAIGGGCYVTHLRPTPGNIAELRQAALPRLFVHVRDPRQAFLSWLHYAEATPGIRDEFGAGQFAERFEKQMDYYVDSVDWIKGWASAATDLNIQFSTFEEFVADQDGFIDRMVKAYGGDVAYFNRAAATTRNAGVDYHIRLGKTDEWLQAFSPEQIDQLNAVLSPELIERFGWPLN